MKYIIRLTVTIFFVLVVATINFAFNIGEMKSKPLNLMNNQIKGRQTIKSHHHKLRKGSFGNLPLRQHPRRLTESQRRYYNNALRNIFIN